MSRKPFTLFSTLFILGLLLRILYFSYTGPYVRQHDVNGHIDHVLYIEREHKMPPNAQCWECYQPPVYYSAGALVGAATEKLAWPSQDRTLQLFSMALFAVFLIFAGQIISEISQTTLQFTLAFCALLVWPSGVMASVRVGNDVAFYAAYSAGLYYFYLWLKLRAPKHLMICAGLAGFSILVKSNGFLLWAMIGAAVLIDLVRDRLSWYIRSYAQATLPLIAGFLAWILVLAGKRSAALDSQNLLGITTFSPGQTVGAGFKNFFYFDFQKFLQIADAGPWIDEKGRQYFWNYLWKTSLVGEFDINDPYHQLCAIILAWLFLVVLIYAVIGFVKLWKTARTEWIFTTLNFVIPLMAIIAMRIWQPVSCLSDFRYIFPSLISMVIWAAAGATVRFKVLGAILLTAFVYISVVFFIVPMAG